MSPDLVARFWKSIPWVRCASGNVSGACQILITKEILSWHSLVCGPTSMQGNLNDCELILTHIVLHCLICQGTSINWGNFLSHSSWVVCICFNKVSEPFLNSIYGDVGYKPIPPNPQGVQVLSMSFSLYLPLAFSFDSIFCLLKVSVMINWQII